MKKIILEYRALGEKETILPGDEIATPFAGNDCLPFDSKGNVEWSPVDGRGWVGTKVGDARPYFGNGGGHVHFRRRITT